MPRKESQIKLPKNSSIYPLILSVASILFSLALGYYLALPKSHQKTILSKVYTVDKIYTSMKGPQSVEAIKLLDSKEPKLLWITAFNATIMDQTGKKQMSQEFMCHSNLDINMKNHRKIFQWKKSPNIRLFTLSQGQLKIEFPEGFGIPILSTETLFLNTQVLNLNYPKNHEKVRHKIDISFIKDHDTDGHMQPLYQISANGLALLEGDSGYFNVSSPDNEKHGPGCLVADNAGVRELQDKTGKKFTGHWVAKPGKEINHTLVTEFMRVKRNTTAHYIAVHLHPFAKSLELRDLTSGISIFKSSTKKFKDKIGLSKVDYFSSSKGIPLYSDHEYELISIYNNTSKKKQDSMAVMYIYALDHEFINLRNQGKLPFAKRPVLTSSQETVQE